MIAEFKLLDHTLTTRGWQFCAPCSGPDAPTWHYLPSRHETTAELTYATTITVVNHTAKSRKT